MMKTFFALTTILTALAFAAPSALADRDGRHRDYGRRYVETCDHCRSPVYAYRRCMGHDRSGRPIYRWIAAPHRDCAEERFRDHRHQDCYDGYRGHNDRRRHPGYYHSRPGFHFGYRIRS